MSIKVVPIWMENIEDEDLVFIKRFILASGSLKEIANSYNVSYPTVRNRLNDLIKKIEIADDESEEPYISLIKSLVIDGKVEFDAAKILISEYHKSRGGE